MASRVLCPLSFVLCGWLAGCNSLGSNQNSGPVMGDPLKGEFGPRGVPPPKTPTPYKKTSAGLEAVPPIPSANSAGSTAALAGNTGLKGGRPLWIGDGLARNDPARGMVAANGVALRRPEPIVQEVPLDGPRPGPVPNVVQPVGGTNTGPAPSYDQLQAQLRDRGVIFQKVDPVPEGVKVSCIVPNRANPMVNRCLEATARDYAAAVQALIQQVDQQR